MEYTCHYASPLGGITLASDGKSLTGLWFDGQKYFADNLAEEHEEKILPVFNETFEWLDIYFSGQEPKFTPPIFIIIAQEDSHFYKWEMNCAKLSEVCYNSFC